MKNIFSPGSLEEIACRSHFWHNKWINVLALHSNHMLFSACSCCCLIIDLDLVAIFRQPFIFKGPSRSRITSSG